MEIDNYLYPISHNQMSQLVGKALTHIEAMNLPQRAEKANKELLRKTLWDWWNDAVTNSITSTGRCIGPIRTNDPHHRSGAKFEWLTNVGTISSDSPVSYHVADFGEGELIE